ncbi:lactococcin 972 family bacteriocin [Streptomyces sp. NPDC060232]|uniref:lactococcin 972 family bacteriocin n=1 Tax=Streptomyces sp. NPDC060232 TaxID=3347079 RepID=UPI00365ECBC5
MAGRSATSAIAGAANAALDLATPATADVTMDASTGSFSPQSQARPSPPSGDTWRYGWYAKEISPGVIHKYHCSHYHQKTKRHSPTVKPAGGTRRTWAAAGSTSHADLTAGLAYTCSTPLQRGPGSRSPPQAVTPLRAR